MYYLLFDPQLLSCFMLVNPINQAVLAVEKELLSTMPQHKYIIKLLATVKDNSGRKLENSG